MALFAPTAQQKACERLSFRCTPGGCPQPSRTLTRAAGRNRSPRRSPRGTRAGRAPGRLRYTSADGMRGRTGRHRRSRHPWACPWGTQSPLETGGPRYRQGRARASRVERRHRSPRRAIPHISCLPCPADEAPVHASMLAEVPTRNRDHTSRRECGADGAARVYVGTSECM
jgi:hypothetical protein